MGLYGLIEDSKHVMQLCTQDADEFLKTLLLSQPNWIWLCWTKNRTAMH